MVRRAWVGAAAALAVCMTPAAAAGSARDVAATHAYIVANYTLARAGMTKIRPAEAAAQAAIHRLSKACPHAGEGSPQNDESQNMSLEAAGALWSAAYRTALGPIRVFAQAVKPLRWSDPRLTRLAHSYATSLYKLATLPAPDLCGDVAAWRASGYATIPPSTLRFDKLVEATEGHTIPQSLLARYERPGDRALFAKTARMETTIRDHETSIGFEDWNELLEALSLQQ